MKTGMPTGEMPGPTAECKMEKHAEIHRAVASLCEVLEGLQALKGKIGEGSPSPGPQAQVSAKVEPTEGLLTVLDKTPSRIDAFRMDALEVICALNEILF